MKTLILCLVAFFSSALIQGQTFQRTFGSTEYDYGIKVVHCTDNNLGIIGFNGETEGIYLLKLDSTGKTLWQRTYDPSNSDYFILGSCFQQTADNGFIIAATLAFHDGNGTDICLVKTDSAGQILWIKSFTGPVNFSIFASANEIVITSDGGFAIVGTLEDEPTNVFIIKTDDGGNLEWSNYYGGTKKEEGYSLKQTPDGGFIIAGSTTSFGQGGSDVYLLRIDSSGNLLWTKTHGNNYNDIATHIEMTIDGEFIITGMTSVIVNKMSLNEELFLMKIDSAGNNVWAYTYGGDLNEKGNSVKQTTDGGFIATGYTGSAGAGQEDVYLLRTDSVGNVLWSTTFGGASTEQGFDVIQDMDHFVIAGETRNFSKGYHDLYVIRTDSSGADTCKSDSAITVRNSLSWVQGTGGAEYSGSMVKYNTIISGFPDTTSYNPCICVPPAADFHVNLTGVCGQMNDLSTWADTWFWDFGNGDTSTVQNPEYCWWYNGVYQVCLTITNDCGTDSHCQDVSIWTGTEEIENNRINLSIAPNPFDDFTTVSFDNNTEGGLRLRMITPLGQMVLQIDNINDGSVSINRSNLPCGIYIVQLLKENQVIGIGKTVIVD